MQVPSLGPEDPLDEGTATHSRILACRILERETWWATVHRLAESDTTEATEHAHTHTHTRAREIKEYKLFLSF